jgi:hypothetical protein
MPSLFRHIALAFFLCCSAIVVQATDYDLGKIGDLSVNAPSSWKVKTRQLGEIGYEISLVPANGANAKALLSIFALPKPREIDAKAIDAMLTQTCERFAPGSVEKKTTLRPYRLKQGYGVSAVFTDASLVGQPSKPNDYKVMSPGLIQLTPSSQIVVTLFADDTAAPEFAAMQAIVETLRLTPVKP